MTHQISPIAHPGYIDKRRGFRDDFETRIVTGPIIFTANGSGTTTTIVGANATPATGTNIVRNDDEFKLFTAGGVLKEETTFHVVSQAVAGSTTVTFSPAAKVATASGDTMKQVVGSNFASSADKDRRLVTLGFSATYVSKLTENDKDYQLRISDDPGSL